MEHDEKWGRASDLDEGGLWNREVAQEELERVAKKYLIRIARETNKRADQPVHAVVTLYFVQHGFSVLASTLEPEEFQSFLNSMSEGDPKPVRWNRGCSRRARTNKQ